MQYLKASQLKNALRDMMQETSMEFKEFPKKHTPQILNILQCFQELAARGQGVGYRYKHIHIHEKCYKLL